MMNEIIAVDFDGTLCKNAWPEIGEPIQDTINYILYAQKELGARLILWTCRADKMLNEAVEWCAAHGIIFDAVNENLPEIVAAFGSDTRKIFANKYIDDRNFAVEKWTNILFECDGKKCKTCKDECIYTTDISHAKNFNLEHGTYFEEDGKC